jgi:DNA invertase Pin-like site-specific DNA recombinase
MPSLIPAVGYVRCSTEMQEDSPEQQKKEIRAFAKLKGYDIIDWFVNFGISGTTFDQRPEFRRLRLQVENNPKFQVVICYDESRWGRAIDAEENTYWRVHFRRCAIDVILVKTVIDPLHEFAPMLKSFEGVQASQYSKKLSELTLRGSMSNGKYSSGGTAPYGYKRMAINLKTNATRILQDGEWCISGQEKVVWILGSEDEVSTVQLIYHERSKGTGYISIAELLNRQGISCPRRGRWKNLDSKWSTVTIKTILDNPVYYGARAYNRNSMSKIQAKVKSRSEKRSVRYPHWRNPRNEWTIEENAHEAIISKELWMKANSFRREASKRQTNQYTSNGEFLLTSKIRCSKCGFAFQGHTTKSKGIVYRRYIDGGWSAKRACEFYGINKEKIEGFAISAVREIMNDNQVLGRLEAALQQETSEERRQSVVKNQNLLTLREQMKGRRSNIMAAISRTSNPRLVDSLLLELEDLDRQMDSAEKELLI